MIRKIYLYDGAGELIVNNSQLTLYASHQQPTDVKFDNITSRRKIDYIKTYPHTLLLMATFICTGTIMKLR